MQEFFVARNYTTRKFHIAHRVNGVKKRVPIGTTFNTREEAKAFLAKVEGLMIERVMEN